MIVINLFDYYFIYFRIYKTLYRLDL